MIRTPLQRGAALVSILLWVTGGTTALLSTVALAYATATSSSLTSLSDKVMGHDVQIGQLKTSTCIQNENIENLAMALHTSFVSDPNCQK